MTAVEVDEGTTVREVHEPGDDEKFSHIVVPASKVTEAYITGTPVRAVCGKEWTPTRDPKKFPICPDCQKFLDDNVCRARGYEPRS